MSTTVDTPRVGARVHVQRFGTFLSNMVMPNIGAIIAWGLITAFFIPVGWTPNAQLATIVGPMIHYLLPIIIAYTGGTIVYKTRGGVVAAIAGFVHSVPAGIVVLVFFVLYQQLENHLLQPVIFARTVKLNPLTVIIAILIAVELAGILGALLAIPVAGILQIIVRDIWDTRRGRLKREPTVGADRNLLSGRSRHKVTASTTGWAWRSPGRTALGPARR